MTSAAELARRAPEAFRVAFGGADEAPIVALRAGGEVLTEARRDELLAKAVARERVELELDVLAYEQFPTSAERPNRKHVRVRDGNMLALGRSGRGAPFLRDHNMDVEAIGGRVLASDARKVEDGHYVVEQTVLLAEPAAVERALRGLMKAVSVFLSPTGPVLCSLCGTEVWERCYHYRGDVVEVAGVKHTVEWIFESAELLETSEVSVGAVPTARIAAIRAALSAAHDNGADRPRGDAMSLKLLIPLLGLAATAGDTDIVQAVELNEQKRKLSEDQRLAAERERDEARAELAALREEHGQRLEDDFIATAVQCGKLRPQGDEFEATLRTWFKRDPKAAQQLLDARSPVTPVGAPRQSDKPPAPDAPQRLAAANETIVRRGAELDGVRRVLKLVNPNANPDELLERHVAPKGA